MSPIEIWRRTNLMRDHRWAQSRISAYLDEELPGRQRRRLAAHEELCPECGRVVRTLRRMVATLGGFGSPQPPSGFAERAVEAIRRDPGEW